MNASTPSTAICTWYPADSSIPFTSILEVMESSTTRIRFCASAGLTGAEGAGAVPPRVRADLIKSVTLRIGTGLPDSSAVAPGDISHPPQRPTQRFDEHFLLAQHLIDDKRDPLIGGMQNDDRESARHHPAGEVRAAESRTASSRTSDTTRPSNEIDSRFSMV